MYRPNLSNYKLQMLSSDWNWNLKKNAKLHFYILFIIMTLLNVDGRYISISTLLRILPQCCFKWVYVRVLTFSSQMSGWGGPRPWDRWCNGHFHSNQLNSMLCSTMNTEPRYLETQIWISYQINSLSSNHLADALRMRWEERRAYQ